MKKFIIKTLIFLITLIIIISFFEYNLSKVPNAFSVKRELLEKNIKEVEILVLGSSHTLSGINPTFFDYKGLNMANTIQSLYYDYQILSKNLDRMSNLKIVLIPVSYFSLEYNLFNGVQYWRSFFYEKFYKIPPQIKSKEFDIRRYSLIALYGGEKSLIWALKRFRVNAAENITENGFNNMPYNIEQDIKQINNESGKNRVFFYNSLMEPGNIPENIHCLEKIIKELKDKGVFPVIITTPVYRTYSDNADIQRYGRLQKNIENLCTNSNIKYFNYFSDPRFVIEDFVNDDHLNPKGAEKFSKIINEEILKKLLSKDKASLSI